jgi:hypothetical protein
MKKIKLCKDCGKKLKTSNSKRCLSCAMKNYYKKHVHPRYIDGRCSKKYYCSICKKEISVYSGFYGEGTCISCNKKELFKNPKNNPNYKNGINIRGKLNPNWKDGISFEPYSSEFNENLKEQIRDRDNHECQNCYMTEEEHLELYNKKLTIHHISYNKMNCYNNNLITLCFKCNSLANTNRDYWYAYFIYLIENYILV